MSEVSITLSVKELNTLIEWTSSKKFEQITITQTSTGIGPATKAVINTSEDEGIWKNLTDYESW
jgi:hypothetical protein